MKKIEFIKLSTGVPVTKPVSDQFMLLAYFLDGFTYPPHTQEVIETIESVRSGEKTFDEISRDVSWGFAEGAGFFECNKDSAYFEPFEGGFPRIEMPLQEVIDLLKEWKQFTEGG
jgi:hypothetical protein